jgi:hypothetical protein
MFNINSGIYMISPILITFQVLSYMYRIQYINPKLTFDAKHEMNNIINFLRY